MVLHPANTYSNLTNKKHVIKFNQSHFRMIQNVLHCVNGNNLRQEIFSKKKKRITKKFLSEGFVYNWLKGNNLTQKLF